MNYRNFTIAGAMALASAAAHAQSSVTLFGLLDDSMVYSSNQKGSSNYQLNNGTLSTSRWGLRGKEDLGGGLAAVFWLESGFDVNSGAFKNGGDLFGRQAYVGLSNPYGSLTFGRQYDFVVDYVAPLTAVGQGFGGNFAAHPYENDNLANDMRLNNAVKFSSVSFNGFKAGAMYAFSNQAGGFASDNAYSAGVSYAHGPVSVAAAYLQENNPGMGLGGAGAVSATDKDQLTTGSRQQIYGVAAKYAFTRAAVGVSWTHSSTNDVSSIWPSGPNETFGKSASNVKFDNFEVEGRYFITPAVSVGASYTYTMAQLARANGNIDPHWHQVMAQADYQLSRRTDVYMEGVYQRISGGGGVFSAAVYNLSPSSSDSQTVVALGLRHRF
ncbi:porin [Paraburkholderia sp. SIMBA_030]|uniref:porin n=1 Tax=Paraburkholderia sp. SIMBA_030 TaxID=3085773 RepID=UPI00397E6E51